MSEKAKTLLEYALNNKEEYDEVYKYIKDNIIEPQRNIFINQEILFANVKELYKRSTNLETIIKEIAKEV